MNEQGLSGQNWFDLIRSILVSILDMVDPLQPTPLILFDPSGNADLPSSSSSSVSVNNVRSLSSLFSSMEANPIDDSSVTERLERALRNQEKVALSQAVQAAEALGFDKHDHISHELFNCAKELELELQGKNIINFNIHFVQIS